MPDYFLIHPALAHRSKPKVNVKALGIQPAALRRLLVNAIGGAVLLVWDAHTAWAACSPAAANSVIATCTGTILSQYGTGAQTNGTIQVTAGAAFNVGGNNYALSFGSLTTVDNYGTIAVAPSANVAGAAISANSEAAMVNNYAGAAITAIASGTGSASGLKAGTTASVANDSSASISGSTNGSGTAYGVQAVAGATTVRSNAGNISASALGANGAANGVLAGTDATVSSNTGTINANAAGSGLARGVYGASSAIVTTNSGTIQGISASGRGSGVIGAAVSILENEGTISGTSNASYGYGVNGSTSAVVTTNRGSIVGSSTSGNAYGVIGAVSASVVVGNNASGASITATSGSGSSWAVYGGSSVNVTLNAGRIAASSTEASASGPSFGLNAGGSSVTVESNVGTISASSAGPVSLAAGVIASTFATVTNTGAAAVISGTTGGSGTAYGVRSGSSTATITANDGKIYGVSAAGAAYGVFNTTAGANIVVTRNVGDIYGQGGSDSSAGLYAGADSVLVGSNSGNIYGVSTSAGAAYGVYSGTTVSVSANTGTILAASNTVSGAYGAYGVYASDSATVANSGAVSGRTAGSGAAAGIYALNANLTLSNGGSGSVAALATGTGTAHGVLAGTYATVSNASGASITATSASGNAYAVRSNNANTSINNSGSISASAGSGLSYGLYLSGGGASIINTGSISGQSASVFAGAPVASVVNWQGGSAVDAKSTALTWTGILPSQYTLGVSSPSRYGQIWFSNPSGTMAVDMDSSSTLALGSYAKAVTGVHAAAISSAAGTQGLFKWQLSLSDSSNLYWDLLVTPNGIASGEIKAASALNQTFMPYFFGGTLQVNSDGSSWNDNFVLDASITNSVALGGKSATFGGSFSNGTGSAGHINFTGSGTAILTASNSYSGGTGIDSGTTLQIGDGGNSGTLGSGTLTNDGVLLVKRTGTLALDMRIEGSGRVALDGGGTLAMLAANTYTGSTTISTGSALVLQGAGSIANSSSVSNQGKFDIRGTAGNIVPLTQFSQGASGQLLMRTSASGAQLLSVTGTASLNGTLTLSAQGGRYQSGSFKLIEAGQIIGTFSNVSIEPGNFVRSYALSYSPQSVDLEMVLGPDSANSRQALTYAASAQTALVKQRNQLLSDMLSQECFPIQSGQSCMAIEGRHGRSTLSNEGTGLISGAWQVSPTLRVGGYVEQGDVQLRHSGVGFSSNAPSLGGFLRWNTNPDGSGLQARLSFATHTGKLQITRDKTLADTEAGSGTALLQSYALGAELAWGIPLGDSTLLKPFLGVQDTRSERGAYMEASSADVTNPISYESFAHNTLYTLAGLRLSGVATDGFSYQLSGGLQYKERRYGSDLSGSSQVYKLEAFALDMRDASANPELVGSADLHYHLGKDQQITATLAMRGPLSDTPQVFKAALGYQVSF